MKSVTKKTLIAVVTTLVAAVTVYADGGHPGFPVPPEQPPRVGALPPGCLPGGPGAPDHGLLSGPAVERWHEQVLRMQEEIRRSTAAGRFELAELRQIVAKYHETAVDAMLEKDRCMPDPAAPAPAGQGEPHAADGKETCDEMPPSPGFPLAELAAKLHLSDKQKSAIADLLAGQHKTLRRLAEKQALLKRHALAFRASGDLQMLRRIADQQVTLREESLLGMELVKAQCFAVLDPAQRVQLQGAGSFPEEPVPPLL